MLDTPIEYLKGIGTVRAEVLKKELGIYNALDLITYYPFRYVDKTKFYTVKEITDDLPYVQIRGLIDSLQIVGQKQSTRLVVNFKDNTGTIDLVWFKGYNWMAQQLKLGTEYVVFGKATNFMGRYNIAHPEIDEVTADFFKQQSAFQSVYNSTEKLKYKGLDSNGIRKIQRSLIQQLMPEHCPENLSEDVITEHK